MPAVGRSLVRLFIISQSAVDGEEEEEEEVENDERASSLFLLSALLLFFSQLRGDESES